MEEIQLINLQQNLYSVIDAVVRSNRSVIIRDKKKILVKITPIAASEQGAWLGCMRDKGKITGDIVASAEELENWKVLSE